jgi:hypothetical protein
MKCLFILVLITVLTDLVRAQDYGEYARGAGLARRRNNR